MLKDKQRTVVISEPHLLKSSVRVGGHQYANIFAKHGWNVILLSATFNAFKLFARKGQSSEYINVWKNQGLVDEETGIVNLCFAHLLPHHIRYSWPFAKISHKLYLPNIQKQLYSLGIEKIDLLWLNGNYDWLYRKSIPHRKSIVRIVDNYAGFNAGYNNFHAEMIKTLTESDAVFACSRNVRDLYQKYRNDIVVIPNGVDYERFSKRALTEPDLLKNIPRPRIIYVGAVAEWFDWELICNLARKKPGLNFVIVGIWEREMPKNGMYPNNVYIVGPQPYETIPGLLSYSEVGIVPFKDCDLVQGVSPIKIYEYLAAGLPVVTLKWDELENEALPVFFSGNIEEFADGLDKALSHLPEQKMKLQQYAQKCSWEHRLKKILGHIDCELE